MWRCDVPEAQAKCNSQRFTEWQAYYEIDPWGEERADLRAGIIASTIANVHRDPKKKAFTFGDFMPDFDPKPKPRQTPVQMFNMLKVWIDQKNAAREGH